MSVITETILTETTLTETIITEDIIGDIRDLNINGLGDSTSDINNIISSSKNQSGETSGGSAPDSDKSYENDVNENLAYDISKTESSWASQLWENAKTLAQNIYTSFMNSSLVQDVITGYTENAIEGQSILGKEVNGVFGAINQFASNTLSNSIQNILDSLGESLDGIDFGEFGETLSNIGDIVSGLLQPYGSGEYPGFAEASIKAKDIWKAGSSSYKITYDTNPLELSNERFSIYGKLILGVPFIFGETSDPTNRTLLNTLVKDSRILSLTPGLPKYNGGQVFTTANKMYNNQVTTFDEMLAYLLQSRIDSKRQSQDTRYYTFEAKYAEYYEYLETALQTVYTKLGLATRGGNAYDFIKIPNNNSSLGFFVNQVNLSENMNNSETSIGAGMASDVNGSSSRFQELNYLTGFGQGSAADQIRRTTGIVSETINQTRSVVGDIFKRTSHVASGKSGVLGTIGNLIAMGANAVLDIAEYVPFNDMSQIAERFTVTNGMKVMYPELWSDSRYSRSISVDFSFTSPYGDPASIFKYVYVPFFALITFAMPRQASHNGLISPFFVRANVPGLFNSDLAMISDVTWNRGGSAGMWTKDGLPRQISGSLTISDLYPFLAQVNSVSILSYNPSYTTWLDTFSGQRAIYDEAETDPMNSYFKQMINNLSGIDNGVFNSGLWNRFSKNEISGNSVGMKPMGSIYTNTNNKSIIWMNKI